MHYQLFFKKRKKKGKCIPGDDFLHRGGREVKKKSKFVLYITSHRTKCNFSFLFQSNKKKKLFSIFLPNQTKDPLHTFFPKHALS